MFRKILSLFGSSRSQAHNESQDLTIKSNETTNSYSSSGFGDVVDGLQFSPTFQIRTPCKILRANGMHVANEAQIPDYLREQQHGIWLPKVKQKYSLDDDNDVGASDASGSNRDDYITFVCSIKDIYSENISIFERVKLIDTFKADHPELLYVEDKLLAYYNNYDSIIDILMFNVDFSFEDLANFHYRDEGYLRPILGINSRVEKSLISLGYKVVEDVTHLTKDQLMELDGVGNKSAEKILEKIAEVKSAIRLNALTA
ncbi:hypothetical protein VFDL14_19920 [Vibrio fortis]|uniref:Helix-hairpin-helix DNA-binding motif class 1 domain-containing protein n=1 Tax=Vibrio fortis TaxID=212667 RepID=A0A066UTT9_9VIBR|nr:helix-hairpin-helix domain-containing protein [Vibrio fortis]KDN27544.1 hypothetical protein VFDL14_19920 [Vibrio fortis]